jgi:hypothetical protein
MKKYLVIVNDPNDSKQVLIEYTGDEELNDEDGYGRYTSKGDYRQYLLYFTKEVQEEHVAILKEYLF